MNKKIIISIILIVCFPLLFSCLFFGRSSSEEVAYIRIYNKSDREIERIHLGSGRQNGETNGPDWRRGMEPKNYSSYKDSDLPISNYDFAEIIYSGGERKLAKWLYPETYLGIPELEVGHYYTFEFDLEGDEIIFNMVEDPAP